MMFTIDKGLIEWIKSWSSDYRSQIAVTQRLALATDAPGAFMLSLRKQHTDFIDELRRELNGAKLTLDSEEAQSIRHRAANKPFEDAISLFVRKQEE